MFGFRVQPTARVSRLVHGSTHVLAGARHVLALSLYRCQTGSPQELPATPPGQAAPGQAGMTLTSCHQLPNDRLPPVFNIL